MIGVGLVIVFAPSETVMLFTKYLYKATRSLNLRASQLDSRCLDFFLVRFVRASRYRVEESPGSTEQNAR